MTNRPSTLPGWASSGTRTDPGSVKRALGWLFGEAPPYDVMNWLQGTISDWVGWLGSNSIGQYRSIADFVADSSVGEMGIICPVAGSSGSLPFYHKWFKTRADIGAAAGAVEHVCTDGEYVFAALNNGAVNAYICCFDVFTGNEVWITSLGVNAAVDAMVCVGNRLVIIKDNAGNKIVESRDRETGAAQHGWIQAGAVDLASNGSQLYVIDSTMLYAFSNFWDAGLIATDWSDDVSARGVGALEAVATNGHLVYVGGAFNTDNFAQYDSAGSFQYTDTITNTGAAGNTISKMFCDDDRVYIRVGSDGFVAWPAAARSTTGAALPPAVITGASMAQGGDINGTDTTQLICSVNGRYIATIDGPSAVIARRPSSSAAYLSPCAIEECDDVWSDIALSPTHAIIGGNDTATNTVLVCLDLPTNGGVMVRKVDPAADVNRAPMFGIVKEIER